MSGFPAPAPLSGFPRKGRSWETLEAEMIGFKKSDISWREGRLPSYTYFFDDEVQKVQMDAYRLYAVENALGEGKAFHSLTRMLGDIETMCLDLFHAPRGAAMSFTSGGTESIFEAVKCARARDRLRGGTPGRRRKIVAPVSAHAVLNKAAGILDLEVIRTPVGTDWRGDVAAMEAAVDDDVIMLFVSAPCFPYGVFDPIEQIAATARQRDLWLHVDGCWGGFISPFASALGYAIPPWDFGVSGVTSLSADLHKFGFVAKGASALIFADGKLKELERFTFSGWPRGTYATPSFLGSRPAGSIASAWAVLQFLGFEGYMRTTKASMDATTALMAGVNAIDGLRCLQAGCESNLFAYASTDPDMDIMAVADAMVATGWFPGRLGEPLAIQMGVNPVHLGAVDRYLSDLGRAATAARKSRAAAPFRADTY